jgi:Uma2 family endonuclease
MATAPRPKMTYEEYLAFERASEQKHEFVDGEIYAMAGARFEHNQLAGNVFGLLWNALRSRGCTVNNSDQRIKTPLGTAHYPDVSALCGDPRFSDDTRDELLNPSVVIEVLSESTEAYDRGKKFDKYATIPSLRAYLLVATDGKSIELRERRDDVWTLRTFHEGERVKIAVLECELVVDDVYAGVTLVEPTTPKNRVTKPS